MSKEELKTRQEGTLPNLVWGQYHGIKARKIYYNETTEHYPF